MEIRYKEMPTGNIAMSVSDPSIRDGSVMYITGHAVDRWIERFSKDTESMCYRALNSRRISSREAKKFKNYAKVVENLEKGIRLYEHGQAMFLVDDKKANPVVVTVMPASFIKGDL